MGGERQRDQQAGPCCPSPAGSHRVPDSVGGPPTRSHRGAMGFAQAHQDQEWNSSTRPDFTWWNSRSSRLRSRPTSSPSLRAMS